MTGGTAALGGKTACRVALMWDCPLRIGTELKQLQSDRMSFPITPHRFATTCSNGSCFRKGCSQALPAARYSRYSPVAKPLAASKVKASEVKKG
jgi:hypothetical protein